MISRAKLEDRLVEEILIALNQDLKEFGEASLLVSGGSTPIHLFAKLAENEIDWNKISISLVDERFLEANNPHQNGTLIKAKLLVKEASRANFIPLVQDESNSKNNLKEVKQAIKALKRPFSATILGMGTDGHTASLFPDADELGRGLNMKVEEEILIVRPKNAPYERITFNKKALLNSNRLFLHCYGEEKKNILDQINSSTLKKNYPIAEFIKQDITPLEIYWTK